MSFTETYLRETAGIVTSLNATVIENCVDELVLVRERHGRVFVLGNGGSAANASHMVNDLRKLTGIEAYAPTDNVAELTARTNDEGWEWTFRSWLKTSQLGMRDVVLILSVGGGSWRSVSPNITSALRYAMDQHAVILGIAGRDGGYTARMAHQCVLVPTITEDRITPHAEEVQSIVCHLLVSHPKLRCTR